MFGRGTPSYPDPNHGRRAIETHIAASSTSFRQFVYTNVNHVDEYWVVKYMPTKYLSKSTPQGFYNDPRLMISTTPGFTWGDAVYVAPLAQTNLFSNAIFGRAGIVGKLNTNEIRTRRVYDASTDDGLKLYQAWISVQTTLYNEATTMFNPNIANRLLRNKFRQVFDIDIMIFPPDQFNHNYTKTQHRWFALSDWTNFSLLGHSRNHNHVLLVTGNSKSNTVEDCKWTILVGEEFTTDNSELEYIDNIGQNSHPTISPSDLQNKIIACHSTIPDSHSAIPHRSLLYRLGD